MKRCALLLLLVCLGSVSQDLHAGVRLDIQDLLNSGAAVVTHTPLDIGTIGQALDGDANTLARSANMNPLVIQLEFNQPQTFLWFRTRFLAGHNQWRMEAADSVGDLEDASGSYQLITDWQIGPEQLWSSNVLTLAHTCRILRFSLRRLTGDDYVHLTDVEFYQPKETIELWSQDNPLQIGWNCRPGSWYAVERSHDLMSWTNPIFLKAVGTNLNWQPTNNVMVQFYRVRSALAEERSFVVKKVIVLNYDPILESRGGLRLHQHFGWNDPRVLTTQYLSDLNEVSDNYVRWQLVEFKDIDEWPLKADGFRYTDHTYLEAWRTNGFHKPDGVDYARIINDHALDRRVREGEIDEVILWGFPYAGYYESRMIGATAYWCNAPALIRENTPLYVMMGLNYERGVAEALHSFGHRAESILRHVYGSWSNDGRINHLWDRFTRYEQIAPGVSACGNVHFPPNGQADYDYDNLIGVMSEADDWLNYPNLTGANTLINANAWGGNQRGYMKWWFTRMPKVSGRHPDGQLNNWWAYMVDMNWYSESR